MNPLPLLTPFRLCAFCKQTRVKQSRNKFCSSRCAGMAKRAPARRCQHCKIRPIRRWADGFCSRKCAVSARGAKGIAHLRRMKVQSANAQRVAYFARVKAFVEVEVDAFTAVVPEPQRAAARLALMKACIRVYRRAYERGYTCARVRLKRGKAA